MKRILFAALCAVLLLGCHPVSEPLARWQHATSGSLAADISQDGSLAAVATSDSDVLLWDNQRETLRFRFRHQAGGSSPILLLAFADSGNYLATAEPDRFALWNTSDGENLGYWQIPRATIRDLAISSNGRQVLLGQSNGVALHLDVASGRRLEFLGHQEKLNSVALSPNGRYALTGGNDHVAYLWDTQTGQALHRFTHPSRVTRVALDVEGRYGFTADSKDQATIWDLRSGKAFSQLALTQRQTIFSAARFSRDGRFLVTGSPDRHLQLWRVSDGRRIGEWYVPPKTTQRPSGGVVLAVAFDSQGIVSESSTGFGARWPLPPTEPDVTSPQQQESP